MDEASVIGEMAGQRAEERRPAGRDVEAAPDQRREDADGNAATRRPSARCQGSRIAPRSRCRYVTVATTLVMSGDRPTNGTFTRSRCLPPTVMTCWSCQAATDLHDPP